MYDNNNNNNNNNLILVILQNKTHSSYNDDSNRNDNYNNRIVIVKCHKQSVHFCVSLWVCFYKSYRTAS